MCSTDLLTYLLTYLLTNSWWVAPIHLTSVHWVNMNTTGHSRGISAILEPSTNVMIYLLIRIEQKLTPAQLMHSMVTFQRRVWLAPRRSIAVCVHPHGSMHPGTPPRSREAVRWRHRWETVLKYTDSHTSSSAPHTEYILTLCLNWLMLQSLVTGASNTGFGAPTWGPGSLVLPTLGPSYLQLLHRPFPFLLDWFYRLSDHLMILLCSMAGFVCMVC